MASGTGTHFCCPSAPPHIRPCSVRRRCTSVPAPRLAACAQQRAAPRPSPRPWAPSRRPSEADHAHVRTRIHLQPARPSPSLLALHARPPPAAWRWTAPAPPRPEGPPRPAHRRIGTTSRVSLVIAYTWPKHAPFTVFCPASQNSNSVTPASVKASRAACET